MNETLNDMSIEQLDDLIARAQATKKEKKEKNWIYTEPKGNSPPRRINIETGELEYKTLNTWRQSTLVSPQNIKSLIAQDVYVNQGMIEIYQAILKHSNGQAIFRHSNGR